MLHNIKMFRCISYADFSPISEIQQLENQEQEIVEQEIMERELLNSLESLLARQHHG